MSKLGQRIYDLRTNAQLNQRDLASILNISNTTLSQYENGHRVPSDEIKIKICEYFDVSLDYLLGNSNIKKKELTDIEAAEILQKKFIEHGIIKEGEDLTDEQLDDYLKKLGAIINAFKD